MSVFSDNEFWNDQIPESTFSEIGKWESDVTFSFTFSLEEDYNTCNIIIASQLINFKPTRGNKCNFISAMSLPNPDRQKMVDVYGYVVQHAQVTAKKIFIYALFNYHVQCAKKESYRHERCKILFPC